MKIKLLILIFIFYFEARAGEKGNGGYSVVCRDLFSKIISAEVLDIYEGRILFKRSYAVDMNSVEEIIDIAKKRLSQHPKFLSKLEEELSLISQNLIYIPDGNELQPTDDAFPPIKKKGCQFEQLANYTSVGEVLISQEIFERLDNVNKAALFIHEAVYAVRRKAVGETNSQISRRITAQLLALNPDQSAIDRWVGDTVYRPREKRPCGLTGDLHLRVKSCSYLETHHPLTLVTRTLKGQEIWLDSQRGLIWSDRLVESMSYERALSACQSPREEFAGLNQYSWRLPSGQELLTSSQVLINSFPDVSTNAPNWFWTSTEKGKFIQIFNETESQLGVHFFRKSMGSVKCVAEIH
jgi:hypothetical protein